MPHVVTRRQFDRRQSPDAHAPVQPPEIGVAFADSAELVKRREVGKRHDAAQRQWRVGIALQYLRQQRLGVGHAPASRQDFE